MYYTVEVVLEREEFQAEFDCVNDSLGTNDLQCLLLMIKAAIPSLEHLISYIRMIRPELRPHLSLAKSFNDVLQKLLETIVQ